MSSPLLGVKRAKKLLKVSDFLLLFEFLSFIFSVFLNLFTLFQ